MEIKTNKHFTSPLCCAVEFEALSAQVKLDTSC